MNKAKLCKRIIFAKSPGQEMRKCFLLVLLILLSQFAYAADTIFNLPTKKNMI